MTLIHTLALPFPVIFVGINMLILFQQKPPERLILFNVISTAVGQMLKLAYTSLIRPHVEFASAAWDPYTARDINQLDKVQCRAARFVNNDYCRTTSVCGLVKRLRVAVLRKP